MKQKRRLARAISRLCMPPPEFSMDDTVIQTGLEKQRKKIAYNSERPTSEVKEYFQKKLNRPAPKQRLQQNSGDPLDINIGELPKKEVHKTFSSLKKGKVAGTDNIPAEASKKGTGIINHLHQVLKLIWSTEKIPAQWSKGLL